MKDIEQNNSQIENDDILKLVKMLGKIPEAPVPDRFELQWERALQEEMLRQKKKRRQRALWRRGTAVAAVFAVGLLSFAMLQDGLRIGNENLALKGNDLEGASVQPYSVDDNVYGDIVSDSAVQENEGTHVQMADVGQIADTNQAADAKAKQQRRVPVSECDTTDKPPATTQNEVNLNTNPPATTSGAGATTSTGAVGNQGSISRSFGHYKTLDEYNKASNHWMDQYIGVLDAKDGKLFAETVAKGGITGYTTDTAIVAFKLYSDYLGSAPPTYKCVNCNTSQLERTYTISGEQNQLSLTIKAAEAGLTVSEPILNHGLWLNQQMKGQEYTLLSYEINAETGDILFNVLTVGEGETEDGMNSAEEVRGVLWTKTE